MGDGRRCECGAGLAPCPRDTRGSKVEMSDLAAGMNAGVGPPRAAGNDLLPG